MVAGALPSANVAIDAGVAQARCNAWAEQDVIEAQPGIARPAIPLVVPESVDLLARVQRPQRIGPALLQQALERRAAFGLQQRVIVPGPGWIDVEVGRHDVVVAGQDDRLLAALERSRMLDDSIEP